MSEVEANEKPGGCGHGAHAHPATAARLELTLALVLLYMGAEVVGGLLSGSLALLADAGHMLSDAGALGLALFALHMARRPPNRERTFGYHRIEILAALANGAVLVAIAAAILIEAWRRLDQTREVQGAMMSAVAVGGLIVNLIGLRLLSTERSHSLNLRGAWMHILADTLGSVQAIVAGLLIMFLRWYWIDAVASIAIALLVIWSAWHLLREAVDVLMESAPAHLDSHEIENAICGLPGVEAVHDLHIWSIKSGFDSLSAHVRVCCEDRADILSEVRNLVERRFGITHVTIQIEGPEFSACAQDRPHCPSALHGR
ncbi:MAG: cation diffusion facilitator family transporter [Vicinamibacteria bacterium]|jgi:cobalt-zinc-cadmium efflux system protein|nr:cation diffusion facilitator family transporter [Vicinamibacteria bacterium]